MKTQQITNSTLVCGKVRFRDFKRIELFEADLGGQHLLLSGPNGSGKTTVLDGLLSILGLAKSKDIPQPIRKGATKAELAADLIDQETGQVRYRLRQEWQGSNRIYTVHDAQGKPIPLRDFQKLIDPHLVNPVEFLTLRPQDQLDEVLRVFGVTPPVDEVREITGEMHPAKENETAALYLERLSGDETGLYYDRRRTCHRFLAQKKAACDEQLSYVSPLDISDPGPTIASLLQKRVIFEELQAHLLAADFAASQARQDAMAKRKMLDDRRTELGRAGRTLLDLRRQVAAIEAEIIDLNGRIAKGEKIVAEASATAIQLGEAFQSFPDPTPSLVALDEEIRQAEEQSEARQRSQLMANRLGQLAEEFGMAEQNFATADLVLEKLRALRRSLLSGCDFGIAGLEVGQGELRLGGVPFRQASLAEAVDCACAIAFRKRPGARIVVIDNGEHLDSQHRQRVIQLATEHGCQLCLAVVRDTQELAWQVMEADSNPATEGIAETAGVLAE